MVFMVFSPLLQDVRLCRLILFGVLFGCGLDALVMATALSGQDPFETPSIVKERSDPFKGHLEEHMAVELAVLDSFYVLLL